MQSDISRLSNKEIKVILRAADPIIAQGGRTSCQDLKGVTGKEIITTGAGSLPCLWLL